MHTSRLLPVALLMSSFALSGCNDASLAQSAPDIEVQPGQLLFDPVSPGTSNTKTATVTNNGGGLLVVEAMEIAGATPSDFQFDASAGGTFPISLAPGEWFAVQVTFSPADAGEHAGILKVHSNDHGSPTVDVPLLTPSLAPDIDGSPNPLAFGSVVVGQSSTQPITVSNLGNADLTVTGAMLGGGSSSAFTVNASVFPATIAPGQAVILPVTFSPASASAAAGTVEITSDDPDEAVHVVSLAGGGSSNPVADVNASPNALAFGQVERLTCKTLTTAVQNVGSAPLNVSSVTRAFLTSAEYTFTPASFTVAAGASQTLTVKFCPTDTGVEYGGLNVTSNDPDENPYAIGLTGEGVPPPVTATDIAIQVTWDKNDTDVDTHFLRPGAAFNSTPGDCYYLNLSPDWGLAGNAADDPYLDYDDVDGYGPENLNYAGVATGTYKLPIYYYGDHGNGTTKVTVKVWLNGTLAYTSPAKTLANQQRWDVMNIDWNAATDSGTITMIDTVTQMVSFAPQTK